MTSRGAAIAVEQGNESEVVVAIVRTFVIGLAALALWSRLVGPGGVEWTAFRRSVVVAGIYNAGLLVAYWRGLFWGRRRYLLLLIDLLLISTWVHLAGQLGVEEVSRVFPFYYLLVIVAAIWYGLQGALVTACAAIIFHTLALLLLPELTVVSQFTGGAMTQQFPILGLIALLVGYLWETHRREREAWYDRQRLLTIYQERIRMSQTLYELFVPRTLPEAPGLDLGLRFRPALRMGAGDYYDVLTLERGRVGICIADVAGKVATAAVKVPILKYALRVAAALSPSPAEVLMRVNRILYPELQPEFFVTACYLVIDPATGELAYANAGHQPPILVEQGSAEPRLLTTSALPFGVEEGTRYEEESLVLRAGDTLLLYTDGVVEARNPERREYGEEQLLGRLGQAADGGRTAQEVAQEIFDDVNEFARHGERRDDMTILVVRLAPKDSSA
ncbi:hypothetical protein AMK68_02055 [candidate division KD3-62 bacterium DG_56]|uniref:PPM-type phosphatase domain-containing protein n=1 Tax=candidate division KD3-62 bacterium DG_56 TaxID=1704032 RepID=A0A0S7XPP2_9BACT|nr:MAG: hypothetical protein AMK68_02055 [candidate division KD3-62 bacterium DG_56]